MLRPVRVASPLLALLCVFVFGVLVHAVPGPCSGTLSINGGSSSGYLSCNSADGVFITGLAPDLSGLANLVSLGSSGLAVLGSDASSLAPLSNLRSILGDVHIENCGSLRNFTGLNNVVNITGRLFVNKANALQDMQGLAALQRVAAIDVDSSQFRSLVGLTSLREVSSDISFKNTPMLASLAGLESLTSVLNLAISGTSLAGLDSLRSVPGTLSIQGVPFTSLAGLGALEAVGTLSIVANPFLATLNGLTNLRSVATINIKNNPTLADLSALAGISSISQTLEVSGCDALRSLAGLGSLQSVGALLIDSNSQLSSLSGLSGLVSAGSVTVRSSPLLSNFTGLNVLSTVSGDVWITANPALRSLAGLEALTSIGGDVAIGVKLPPPNFPGGPFDGGAPNTMLASLAGLSSLRSVGGALLIQQNPVLASLSGLEGLSSAGSLVVSSNPLLLSLSGLSSLSGVATSLSIQLNDALPTMVGLDALVVIGTALTVEGNVGLTSLRGLESLQQVLSISISGNPSLADITALSSLQAFSSASIVVECCPAFTFYAAISMPLASIACKDCFNVTARATELTLPAGQPVRFALAYSGATSRNPVYVRASNADAAVATTVATCAAASTQIVCAAPRPLASAIAAHTTPLRLEVSTNRIAWSPVSNLSLSFIGFDAWADAPALTAGSSTFSTSPTPGLPDVDQRTSDAADLGVLLIILISAIGGGLFLLFLLSVFTCCSSRVYHRLDRLDYLLFVREEFEEGQREAVLSIAKTPEGGIGTGFAMVMVAALLTAYIAEVAIDNTAVAMATDPRPTAEIVLTNYKATVTFSPVRNFVDDSPAFVPAFSGCLGWFQVSAKGFSSPGNASCVFDAAQDAVTVEWVCADCSQELGSSSLSIIAPSANAFTRSLLWSFSSLDYFRNPSTVQGTMRAEAGQYFKGTPLSQAALVSLNTRFTNVGEPTRVGKLMSVLTAQRGSQVTAGTFGASAGVGFEFTLGAQPGWFTIVLTQKSTPLAILAQILALVTGILGAFKSALGVYLGCRAPKKPPHIEMLQMATVVASAASDAKETPRPVVKELPLDDDADAPAEPDDGLASPSVVAAAQPAPEVVVHLRVGSMDSRQ